MALLTRKMKEHIGYEFKDPGLLQHALSHRSASAGKKSNERLEFLGDAVLNFVIGAELFDKHPKLEEGELSRLRAYFVNGEVLAELAREMQIGEFIHLGIGEAKSGGERRTSILADTMEAIIGAVYLDSGLEEARTMILHWYEERLKNIPSEAPKDNKTKLQEMLQALKFPLPSYSVISVEGEPHNQVFHIECKVHGILQTAVGVGHNKRKAEQNAAEAFLAKIKSAQSGK